VQQLFDSFGALTEADKHQAGVEILRRLVCAGAGDLPEEAPTGMADELFRALDAGEAPCTALTAVRSGDGGQGEADRPREVGFVGLRGSLPREPAP
jgi:hypothetical protein